MIYIYYTHLVESNHLNLLENELPKFSLEFQERVKKFRRWQDAQFSILGRILLSQGMKEIYNCGLEDLFIKYTKYNKPYFDKSAVQFNISHSGEIVVCVFSSQHSIGVDIELISDIEIENFYFQMTEYEKEIILRSSDKKTAFFNYWTKKEAVIKACGIGLSLPLTSFELRENTTNINGETYFFDEIKIDKNYKCHISQNAFIEEVVLKKININT